MLRSTLSLTLLSLAPLAFADTTSMKKGTPELQSATTIAFAPNGMLLVGDSQSKTIFAIATGDSTQTAEGDVDIEKLGDKVGSALGTTGENIVINDMKVNPASGTIYLAASRKGQGAGPVILQVARDGKLSELPMKDVMFSSVALPNAVDKDSRGRSGVAMTSIAFVDNKVVVAGLSSEEFASTLWTIPYPFEGKAEGTGVEIFHGAHGQLETRSPIQTFVPYQISGADYLMAAYTCTPLVKVPVKDLKANAKIHGKTIAELGNRNKPLDMIVYQKDGKDYVLIANSARGVMKVPAEPFADAEEITTRAEPKTGVQYETIESLKGVTHLDKLDDTHALLVIENDGVVSLKSVELP